jgi:threonine synthase
MRYSIHCLACGTRQADAAAIACHRCGGSLGFGYDLADAAPDPGFAGMWRYWRMLPVDAPLGLVTLGEGGTPLLASSLRKDLRLWWKDETRNPTGSHKDRALSLALTHARRVGARVSVVVSAGSTGLSNAAYAARAGLASVTLIPAGAPAERVFPLSVYGSRLIEVAGGIDAIIAAARGLAGRGGIYVASTTRASNPVQAEAAKTIAHEIVRDMGDAPHWMVVPVGGGGTIAGLWRGFLEMRSLGRATRLPRLAAVVPGRYDALRAAFQAGVKSEAALLALDYRDDVPTLLTKLSHAHPPDGMEALAAVRASEGTVVAIDDDAAVAGSGRIAAADGLYLEPSSGVVAPGLDTLLAQGVIEPAATVVGLACGSGFRETFALMRGGAAPIEHVSLGDLAAALS